jgi:RNA polymerase sigma-70 factor (sigma-E family)
LPATDEREYRDYVAARMIGLRRIAYLICGDWHLAEDAVSAVLTKLYTHWAKATGSDNLDAYVRRMLVRSIVDERRRPWRRERPVAFPVEERAAPPDPTEDRLVVRAALAALPPRRRAVLVLRFYEGLSVEETAAAMGTTTGTVKSQTARALAALRDGLPGDLLDSSPGEPKPRDHAHTGGGHSGTTDG